MPVTRTSWPVLSGAPETGQETCSCPVAEPHHDAPTLCWCGEHAGRRQGRRSDEFVRAMTPNPRTIMLESRALVS